MDPALTAVADSRPDPRAGPSTPARQMPGLAAFAALLVLVQHARVDGWPVGLTVFVGVAAVLALAWLWRSRRGFFDNLTSVSFSAGLLAVIAGATALGTFVVQGEMPAPTEGHPAGLGAHVSALLFLHALFRSLWFGGLLALLAVSLVLTVLRRPFWRARHWGFALGHGGMVVLLLGGLLGRWLGTEGQMNLHVGQPADRFQVRRHGALTGESRPLDFSLRLEAFDVEKYPRKDPCVLTVYRRQEEGPESCPAPLCFAGIPLARQGFTVPATGIRVRVRKFYPDAAVTETMEESADPDLPPAARIRLKEGAREDSHWVVESGAPHALLGDRELEIEWGALGEAGWTARTAQGRPAAHRILVPGNPTPLEVSVGGTYTLPGTAVAQAPPPGLRQPRAAVPQRRVRVSGFYPDFSYNIEKHEAFSASDEPRNPALAIEVLEDPQGTSAGRTQYLFSGQVGHMGKDNALDLTYRYEPPVKQVAHLIRLDGRARQFAYAAAGREVAKFTFEPGRPQELPLETGPQAAPRTLALTVTQLLSHASPRREARALSEKLGNPAALVEVERGSRPDERAEAWLDASEICWLELGDGLVLVLEKREEEVKTFRSHLSVLRDGQVVHQAVAAVNDPLTVDGYSFYQSDYRPDDPTFSGLKVVRDPGLGLVYLGMLMAALGITYTLYVRPFGDTIKKHGVPEKPAEGAA